MQSTVFDLFRYLVFGFQVVEMSTSKTGKHGHAKVHMVAIGEPLHHLQVLDAVFRHLHRKEVGGYLSIDPQHGCSRCQEEGVSVALDI